jgi:uncharacterized membrane protein
VLAIVLGLGSSMGWGVADFLGGVASRRASALGVVAVSQLAGLTVLAVILALRGDGPPPAAELGLGAAAGAVGAVGLAAFYRALAVGSMSLVAPIAALGAVIPVAIGLAGGDRLGPATAVGLPLAIGGAALMGRARGPASRRGLGLAVVAAVGFGLFFALLAPAAEHDVVWAATMARVASVPTVVAAAAVSGAGLALPRRVVPVVLLAGLLDAGANVSFAAASQRGLVSVVAVLGSLYPVVTVALARAVLDERVGRAQAAGVAAALTGVVLIAAGAA